MFLVVLFIVTWVSHAGASSGIDPNVKRHKKHYKEIIEDMKTHNIEENLRYFSKWPHHAGSNRSEQMAYHIAEKWRKSGFDRTEVYKYNAYLSYPQQPSQIWLRDKEDITKKIILGNEPAFDDSERKGKILYPFNAFSPAGTVTGEYVYCNYGERSDFQMLFEHGIDLKGKIAIFRYGKLYRGSKVRQAEKYGAIGVIIFSDPYDFTIFGSEYPDGWTLNRYGVQRGTVNRNPGDSLSIGYPSKPNYWRKSEKKYSGNPKIPSQPISFSTAYDILTSMKNDSVPLPGGFQGGLNFTYVLQSGKGRTLTLIVKTHLETRDSITVCTTLYGKDEPDRYVLIGNHRDSWSYGASDASSGTSSIVEIVRAIGRVTKKTGWRPRRSLMACSWGTEEPGTIGSTEWTDDHRRFISQHVVTYINADMIVDGNYTVGLRALDIISEGVYDASKIVSAPRKPRKSLYDDWLEKMKYDLNDNTLQRPGATFPEDISDFDAFWLTHGTTVTDIGYVLSERAYPRFGSNSQYHTRYDSFAWMTKFIDPDFTIHLATAQLCASQMLSFSDSIVMPFNVASYVKQVKRYLKEFEGFYKKSLARRHIDLKFVKTRLNALIKKADRFHDYISKLNLKHANAYEIRSINDKLMNFERNFLLPNIVEKDSTRHVIYGATPYYLELSKFPGITEAIYFATNNEKDDWDVVRKQITLLVWCIDSANRSLDFDDWSNRNKFII